MPIAIPQLAGVPLEFFLFASVLLGVALFHNHTLRVAVLGLATIVVYKLIFSPFHGVAGAAGLAGVLAHEWVLLANLLGLLLGFALLSRHFEESAYPSCCHASCPMTGREALPCSRWSSCCRASSTTSLRP